MSLTIEFSMIRRFIVHTASEVQMLDLSASIGDNPIRGFVLFCFVVCTLRTNSHQALTFGIEIKRYGVWVMCEFSLSQSRYISSRGVRA
jgi:hypothetical protein